MKNQVIFFSKEGFSGASSGKSRLALESPPPARRKGELDSLWFAKTFAFALLASGALMVSGTVSAPVPFPADDHKAVSADKGKRLSSAEQKTAPQQTAALSFPPFPVNLRSGAGNALALVKIDLKTDRPAAKKEILSKNKKFKKHLLLLLSGKERGDLTKNKERFEEEIRSQFNTFLSQGSVKEVRFQTTAIN